MNSVYLTSEPQEYLVGDGTHWNPYDASTREKFDTIMSGLPPCTEINLLPGTYYTRGSPPDANDYRLGDWFVKSGWHIKGAGIGKTKVVLDLRTADGLVTNGLYAIFGMCIETYIRVGDVIISDITFDMWGHNPVVSGQPLGFSAVNLYGTRNTVKDIEIINYASYSASRETFLVSNAGAWEIPKPAKSMIFADNLLVDNVYIHDMVASVPVGGMLTCILLNGGGDVFNQRGWARSPVIRNCRVLTNTMLNTGTIDTSNVMAFQMTSCENGVIENNLTSGCFVCYYNDSWGGDSVVVRNNKFLAARKAITLNCGAPFPWPDYLGNTANAYIKSVIIENNEITLRYPDYPETNVFLYACRPGIEFDNNGAGEVRYYIKNFVARNNVITWANPKTLSVGEQSFCAFLFYSGISGIYLENNYINLPMAAGGTNGRTALIMFEGNQKHNIFMRNNSCKAYCSPSGIYIPQQSDIFIPYLNQT